MSSSEFNGNSFDSITQGDDLVYAERALRAGARGYVMKQETLEEILAAIRAVLLGRIHVSRDMAGRLLHKLFPRFFAALGLGFLSGDPQPKINRSADAPVRSNVEAISNIIILLTIRELLRTGMSALRWRPKIPREMRRLPHVAGTISRPKLQGLHINSCLNWGRSSE